jgi:hypothetical protein
MRFLILLVAMIVAMVSANYNETQLTTMPSTCFTSQSTCMSNCRTPDYGSTCDSEISGNNMYWCCHNPAPGCFSNSNDAYSHCSTNKITKVDEFYYCCVGADCCKSGDSSCNTGDVCCLKDCNSDPLSCSYTESGCGGAYGAKHSCEWDDKMSLCLVGE